MRLTRRPHPRPARAVGATTRWAAALGTVLVLSAVPGAHGPAVAQTGPDAFGGYQASASGEAFSLRPHLPALLPTDVPFEATVSHAFASLSTGGQGFGRASTLYPGSLVAGLRPLLLQAGIEVPLPDYPIVVESRSHDDRLTDDLPGVTMVSDVDDDRAEVTSDIGGFSIPAILDVGSIETVSRISFTEDGLVAETVNSVARIDLLQGALRIDGIQSTARVTSDGESTTCEGSFEIGDVRLAGLAATIDEDGLHLDAANLLPLVDLNQVLNRLVRSLGIEIAVLESFDACDGPAGNRTTGGLRITVALPEIRPLPPGARVDITFASANAAASANPAFTIDPAAPAPPPSSGGSGVVPGGTGTGTGGTGSPGTVDLPSPPVEPDPPAEAPPQALVPVTDREPYRPDGVPVSLAVGLMLLAVPGARRIRLYLERLMAMTGGAP